VKYLHISFGQVPDAISSIPPEMLMANGHSPFVAELSPSAMEYLYICAVSAVSAVHGFESIDKAGIGKFCSKPTDD
jgi:hypothetical protein